MYFTIAPDVLSFEVKSIRDSILAKSAKSQEHHVNTKDCGPFVDPKEIYREAESRESSYFRVHVGRYIYYSAPVGIRGLTSP